ncbi:hypothetical protein AB7M37_000719 [Sinorhizobium fredii]
MRWSASHVFKQCSRSTATPEAVWYRSSAVLARSFMTIAATGFGIPLTRSSGGIGCLAMWQWIHSIGSEAVNGSVPVSISYSVTPSE